MRIRVFPAVAVWLAAVAGGAAAAAEPQRPNIVFFLVDDMGWQDTSVPFWRGADGAARVTFLNRRYRTPNMQRLAEEGLMFTRAYASPICSPTRCSLVSGMNAARHRVTNWTLARDTETDEPGCPLRPPAGWSVNGVQPAGTAPQGVSRHPITEEPFSYSMQRPFTPVTPLPELLRGLGYVTIHCGKAHWGSRDTPGANPRELGFDYNIAGTEAGGVADYRGRTGYGAGAGAFAVRGMDKPQYRSGDVFLTEALTQEALACLGQVRRAPQHAGKPFFLYMAHYAVHCPLDARAEDPRFTRNYPAGSLPVHPQDSMPWSATERCYAALVEGMDKSLGDICNWLQANGLAENTVVVFMSDNGGLALRSGGRLGDALSNYPLRGGKGCCYEGGIRVPLLVYWPGTTPRGGVCSVPAAAEDLFPTILELAGAATPPATVQQVDGRSLVPLLRGGTLPADRPLLFHVPHNWVRHAPGSTYSPQSALVRGNDKLLYFAETDSYELYDLAEDISEQHDLSASHPARLEEMKALLQRRLQETGAQQPRR